MRVLVYGLGRSGLAAGLLAASQGNRVAFFDRRDEGEDIDRALAEGWERPPEPTRWAADLCIAAPGVPINHPDLVALRRAGVETIGEVEWVYRSVRVPIVGITGTAGKSTVTAWTTHILRQAGHPAVAGGNIDPPLCSVAAAGTPLIAELSSFQLERCPTLRPKVAAVLNLGEDHLDRHGSLEAYQAAKRNAVANQGAGDTMVIAASDQTLAEWAYDSEARVLRFGTDRSCDGKLVGGRLVIAGREVCNQDELSVAGAHNRTNALAAALIAYAYGLPPAALEEGLRTAPAPSATNVVETPLQPKTEPDPQPVDPMAGWDPDVIRAAMDDALKGAPAPSPQPDPDPTDDELIAEAGRRVIGAMFR